MLLRRIPRLRPGYACVHLEGCFPKAAGSRDLVVVFAEDNAVEALDVDIAEWVK